jgi:putative oxidoreductase
MASLDWLAPLMVRIYFGYFWAETGWGKIHNLDAFTQRFIGWGIPYPHFSAALSGYTEWIGGLLIMLGLLTRLVSIPMMFNMFVAIVKVKMNKVTGIDDFVEMDEALYMFIFFWLIMAGPGRISIDYLIRRALGLGHQADGAQHGDRRAPFA